MPHPDDGLIHAWLDGELDAAESARVSELVARDRDWAAAAAEARGLIAASSRITVALDGVPGNVVPRKQPSSPAGRWSTIRAAALILVVASAATLWHFEGRGRALDQPESAPRVQASPTPSASGTPTPTPTPTDALGPARVPATGNTASTTVPKRESQPSAPIQNSASNALARRPRDPQPADSGRAVSPAPRALAQSAAAASAGATRDVVAGARCFETRQPTDSTVGVLRFPAAALSDSLKLGVLRLQGDSLMRARRLLAIAVRCQEP